MHLPSFFLYLSALLGVAAPLSQVGSTLPILFAATSTSDPAKGVYTYKFNSTDGSLTQWGVTPLTFASGALNPTYLQESTKKYDGKPLIYALNRATGVGYVSAMTLNANGTLDLLNSQVMLGGSPAHITLSPNEDFVAVANYAGSLSLFPLYENGTIAPESRDGLLLSWVRSSPFHLGVYKVKSQTALLESPAIQNITTLPENYTTASTAADIHLSKNGKFVYVSNRGHNSIAIYAINEADGMLSPLGWESRRGSTPRDFTVYQDWLIVANQVSDDMYVFRIDEQTGLLSYSGNSYVIDGAVCLYVSEYAIYPVAAVSYT